jgi:oligopeptide transport system substrate-binding protein
MRHGGYRVPAAALAVSTLLACSQQTNAPAELASDQTLRATINAEPRFGHTSLDPAHVSFGVENAIGDNLFDGLYRFDDQLNEQPDIADGLPSVSADALTYTFHLRHSVRFWNGEPVTANDVVYSWNRAATLKDDWAYSFQPVVGYDAVSAGSARTMSGLSATDPYTIVARLSTPAGYWLTELALPVAWIVSQKAVESGGDRWWADPNTLVGTGPFRLTSWTPDTELDFSVVPKWWGGSTGALRRIELHVEHDPLARWKGYIEGSYDVMGFLRNDLAYRERSEVSSFLTDPTLRQQVHNWPSDVTSWLGFNLQTGPFSGYGNGAELRRAFSQAIDRRKLARAICVEGTLCEPATGGLIPKGLVGYLGDGADPMAKFDPSAARATVKRLDPDGSHLRGLVFYYPLKANYDPTQAVAENLRAQWLANLGLDVSIRGLDQTSFFTSIPQGKFTLWRGGWQADYDHPQDWFDNLFLPGGGCEQGPCNGAGAVYDRPGYAAIISRADQGPLQQTLPAYEMAGHMLLDDSALGTLYYDVQTAVVKPYVDGYGANAMNPFRWTSIRILLH